MFLSGLASVRARLVALLLFGAVPVVAMAAVVVWQNYRSAIGRAVENTLLLMESASARHSAAVEDVRHALAAIGRAPELMTNPEFCSNLLLTAIDFRPDRYLGLAVLDVNGKPVCRALMPGPGLPARSAVWPTDPDPPGGFATRVLRGADGAILLDVSDPIVIDGRVIGHAIALLRVDWLVGLARQVASRGERAVWLINPGGVPVATAGALDASLPEPRDLRTLLHAPGPVVIRASANPNSYAAAQVEGGLRMLVGYDASEEARAATRILVARIAELGLLLLLGLAAVALGASLAVIEPLKRLTRAVGRWRSGASFDPGNSEGLPSEVRQLWTSFAQATDSLRERERQLRLALEQQELLMQEIHHRVKNNLQIVASLLNLQAARIRQPEARAEFQSARDRVRALATLHRHLYTQGELHTINMRSFLTELCGQLFQALGETAGERIHLHIEAPELQLSSDQAVPLALIVTETVSNAVKYAFPGKRQGNVSVLLTADAAEAQLVIEDDGIGLPAGRSETETGIRDGIGLRLVRGFARQLGAALTVTEGHGTRYVVKLRLGAPVGKSSPVSAAA